MPEVKVSKLRCHNVVCHRKFDTLLVWQEIEFINMETKVLKASRGTMSNWGQDCGASSRQSAFVVEGFQPLSPFLKRSLTCVCVCVSMLFPWLRPCLHFWIWDGILELKHFPMICFSFWKDLHLLNNTKHPPQSQSSRSISPKEDQSSNEAKSQK